jgi:hypothetical protein
MNDDLDRELRRYAILSKFDFARFMTETVLSETLLMLCSQAEQPFGRGLNLPLSNPGA